jgi:hypothetical protein
MAAAYLATVSPSLSNTTQSYSKRPPLALTERRLAANRRNAARSTGPRTAQGKARAARNAIKHGFFADAARWTTQQHRDFEQTFFGLCDDFRPLNEREQICVAIIADSFVRIAAMLRYENLAALKHHQQCERELEARIAAADTAEAARLRAHRENLRRAGLWGPTIPGPREIKAIIRYEGRLRRRIHDAGAELENLQRAKSQKQTHFIQRNRGIFDFASTMAGAAARPEAIHASPSMERRAQHRTSGAKPRGSDEKNAKTNPLSSMFTGNRHERRKAKALARRKRT